MSTKTVIARVNSNLSTVALDDTVNLLDACFISELPTKTFRILKNYI